jgi:ABC-type transporter Mla maintaining outer membrane lipid asymmetry ATPase subunit MlaF
MPVGADKVLVTALLRSGGADDPALRGDRNSRRAVVHAQLAVDVHQVGLDSCLGNEELPGDAVPAAAALIRPTSGVVTVDGQEATGLRDAGLAALRRDKVGIIFQQPNLLPSLTALDQLLLTN